MSLHDGIRAGVIRQCVSVCISLRQIGRLQSIFIQSSAQNTDRQFNNPQSGFRGQNGAPGYAKGR